MNKPITLLKGINTMSPPAPAHPTEESAFHSHWLLL